MDDVANEGQPRPSAYQRAKAQGMKFTCVTFSAEDYALIEGAAKADRRKVGQWIRMICVREATILANEQEGQ